MRSPSSKTSRVSADQSVPPISAICAMLPVHAMSRSSAKTGATIVMSGRCPEVSQGSLQIPTSPGRHSGAGRIDRKCASVRDSVMLKEGMPMVFSAIAFPSALKITQAKSLDSRTIGEKEVRRSVAAASSAMAMSRVQTTWSATGSSTMARLRGGARSLAMITSWGGGLARGIRCFLGFSSARKIVNSVGSGVKARGPR